jgi:hypothetical protein
MSPIRSTHHFLTLRFKVDDSVQLQFSVSDSGIGIPANMLRKIFEPFTQADNSSTRRYGGAGLGLAVCVRMCEIMGGSIWAESVEGIGTTIHFTIRCTIPKETPKKRQVESGTRNRSVGNRVAEHESKASRLRVLIVEHIPINQYMIFEFLRKRDYAPGVASNACARGGEWQAPTGGRTDGQRWGSRAVFESRI